MSSLIYSSSPHVRCSLTTKKIMLAVVIALLPACVAGCIYFGWSALLVLALSTVSAVASEIVYLLLTKKPINYILEQFDYTSVVTGLLIGMNLTANCPWYVPVLASIFAIVAVKMIFGGTGRNLVNPAIAGRIFAFISFGATFGGSWIATNVDAINTSTLTTGATPLTGAILSGDLGAISVVDLLLGTGVSGVIGETCKVAHIAGGI
ncbi:MAG: RnfABCDGE type electron transport complex subunit D, partial [Clostridia bacterium]|nr:RnfABCDGE type electron transport complex subunit D [Clostridia bacterium]